MSTDDKMSAGVGLWIGSTFAAVVAISIVAGVFTLFSADLRGAGFLFGLYALVQVGAWQWLYVIPLIISLRRKQRFQTAKGLLITACVLLGLDVLCSGVLIFSLAHISFH